MIHVGRSAACTIAMLLAMATVRTGVAQPLTVNFRGTVSLASTATDQNDQSFMVTGLSGLTWVEGTSFVAVMDNSDKLVFLDVELNADGSIGAAAIVGGLTLANAADFEGIAFTTDVRDSVFISEEGTPAVREYGRSSGALLQSLSTPPVFFNRRSNRGFESLARHSDGSELWTANEEALTVDGDASSPTHGTIVRLLRYELVNEVGGPGEQYAYEVEPMHGGNISNGRSGLVDLCQLPNGTILALERSLAFSIPDFFQNRLYELDFAGATDVSGFTAGLVGETFTPVTKLSMWTGSLGNLEGLALGPPLTGGNRALLGIVDDGDPLSTNLLVAFELAGPVDPPCAALAPGNTNCDFAIDGLDVAAFTFALIDPIGHAAAFPECDAACVADVNQDGDVNVGDVDDLVACLLSAVCP
ncbi:MAG: esterase-like activity of phytase family protein [Planctomycetota bacterium]|nr:esterase-like activity of phytase family protein [Planctomycetota bacterium]